MRRGAWDDDVTIRTTWTGDRLAHAVLLVDAEGHWTDWGRGRHHRRGGLDLLAELHSAVMQRLFDPAARAND